LGIVFNPGKAIVLLLIFHALLIQGAASHSRPFRPICTGVQEAQVRVLPVVVHVQAFAQCRAQFQFFALGIADYFKAHARFHATERAD